ncbi:MAG: hypothetical protein ACRCX8_08240 [Sarcina sp.]
MAKLIILITLILIINILIKTFINILHFIKLNNKLMVIVGIVAFVLMLLYVCEFWVKIVLEVFR